ncbi:MAG: cytochrome P450, partial [Planctomycetes bacterium]|nr:cytochrome P450 [Planctomycetota bacterium]
LVIPTRAHRRFRHDREFLDNLIHSALTRGTTPSNDKTLIADMIHGLNAANGSGLTLTAARDEVITLCSAGQLTTANALVWSWYVLSTHPQWRDRLVEEIDSVVGGNEPTGESLERMALLDRIVCETLRLYPPIWIFTRRAMVDGLIGALPVPAGSELLISPYVIHRHPQHWPDPDDFDPDRFLPEAVARRNRHAYLPFGSGPRNCIGAQFALAEIKMVLVRVLQHFFLDLAPGGPVVPLAQMTLNVRGGLRMTHRRRRT